ncbi:hypothetical protein GXW78_25780 [Roseomonas terrae]|uniref:Uncharacterized protein n=1 Tax=Neoroseomonas terrae TaxID=424799 RepID=A0ABS5EQ15_9PROT|nr:hypothetical protein [Neoroseomonas terrae]MBR0653092.1 hypothetical protein [Neoroseomonas terrae]
MRRAAILALCAFALPAAAQDAPAPFVTVTPPASVPPVVVDAVQRMPPTGALEAPLRAAPCVFAPVARHLERLPANMPWARPEAVVLFGDLPGLPPGSRAAVLRPTRELLARAATRQRIAEGGISLHDYDLAVLPADAAAPAFLAIHVAPPAAPPEDCVAQGPS